MGRRDSRIFDGSQADPNCKECQGRGIMGVNVANGKNTPIICKCVPAIGVERDVAPIDFHGIYKNAKQGVIIAKKKELDAFIAEGGDTVRQMRCIVWVALILSTLWLWRNTIDGTLEEEEDNDNGEIHKREETDDS